MYKYKMVRNLLVSLLSIRVLVLAQTLAGQYEFWDYYGTYVHDYSGNGRHAEISNSVILPVLTDRGLYISDGYTLKFPKNSYQDFPTSCTDMVISVLFYPKTDNSFCLVRLTANTKVLQVCFKSVLSKVNIEIQGSWANLHSTEAYFNEWQLYTVRFSSNGSNCWIFVYLNGVQSLLYYISSFNFVASITTWEIGSSSIEGLLYQIWWHCDVTVSIQTLSESMIAPPSNSCTSLHAMKPYKRCLSNQIDKFKNSENEDCYNCVSMNQSCNKDQVCIQSSGAGQTSCISQPTCFYTNRCTTAEICTTSCQYKCITPSGCRSLSYPICSTPPPPNCSSIPGTDICHQCNIGWIMSVTTPGICEITVPGCKTFNSSAVCIECQASYYMTSTTPPGCMICPNGCIKCSLNTSGTVVCSQCPEGQFIHTGPLCFSICPEYYYGDILASPNKCLRCRDNCKSCIYKPAIKYTICTECSQGLFLHPNMNSFTIDDSWITQCRTKCPSKYYRDSSATPPICKPCRLGCDDCTDSTNCTKCSVGYMLSTGSTQCIACVSECANCKSITECDRCTDGVFLDNKQCTYCVPLCEICNNSNTCISCYTYANTVIANGITLCYIPCNHIDFRRSKYDKCADYSSDMDKSIIAQCETDNSLVTCKNCLTSQYAIGNCPATRCGDNCKKCNTINGVMVCSICAIDTFVQPDQQSCKSTCPEYYYIDYQSSTCKICKPNCRRCQMNPNICEECGNGHSLSYYSEDCVQSCPEGYYSDRSGIWKCMPCVPNCSKCTSSNECQICLNNLYSVTSKTGVVSCETTCPPRSYYDSNRVCYYCMNNCDVCGVNTNGILTCSTCSVGYILINQMCVELKCDPNCISCFLDATTLRCDKCNIGFYIDPFRYKCLTECPDYYYEENETERCESCMPRCKICEEVDGTELRCNDCDYPYYLRVDRTCGTECEEGYYPDPRTRKCPPCFSNCLDCLEDICLKCKPTFVAKPAPVDNTNACLPCSKNCIECEYIENRTVCTQCDGGFYFQPQGYSLECDKTCPDGYYIDMESLLCRECPVGKYEVGAECLDCDRPCTKCSRVDKCSECIENAEVYNDMCDCISNYEFDGVECVEKYFDLEVEYSNYTLILYFEYPLKENLSFKYIDIIVDQSYYNTTDLIITSSDIQKYNIILEASSLTSKNELILQFNLNYPILDIYDHTLYKTRYSFILPTISHEESDSNLDSNIVETSNTTEKIRLDNINAMRSVTFSTIKATGVTSLFISFINIYSSNLWALLNTIQILNYIPLISITMPARSLGVCKALSFNEFLPNIFELFIEKQGPELESKYTENEIETVQFIINTGQSFTILSSLIVIYFSLKLVQLLTTSCDQRSRIQAILRKAIGHYEWSAFIRFYIESYLDLSFYSMLNLYYLPISNMKLSIDFMVSCIFLLLTFISPLLLLIFTLKNLSILTDTNSDTKCSTLYEGFKILDHNINYHVVFLARRFLYAVCIVILGSSPHFQVIALSTISYYEFCYILTFRPYSSNKQNILNCFSEGCIFVIISLLFAFNFEIGDVASEYIDYVIVVILHLSFLVPVSVNLIEAIVRIIKIIMRRLRRNDVSELYNLKESKVESLGNK